MAWSRDPRKPTRYMRGSKRYNDVGGHSPPGDELENTRDHERIWFELKRNRSCCDCDDPGFKYCFQTFDYPSYICGGDFSGGDTLHGYWTGLRKVIGLSDGLAGACGTGDLTNVNLTDLEPFDNGSWRNGPYVNSNGAQLDLASSIGITWAGAFPNVAWTLEFWLKPSQGDIDAGNLLVGHGLAGENLNQGGLDIRLRTGGGISMEHIQVAAGAIQESGAGWFEGDQWHHVAIVRNLIARTVAIFVNGRIAISRVIPTTGWDVNEFPSTPAFIFGQNGAWSDVAFYDSALSPTIIRRHYQAVYGVEGAANPLASVEGDPTQVEDPTQVITEQISIDLIDGGGDGLAGYIPISQGDYAAWVSPEDSPFELEERKGQADGYAGLDSAALVPTDQLGTGTADATTFLRGDQTYEEGVLVPPATDYDQMLHSGPGTSEDYVAALASVIPSAIRYPLTEASAPYSPVGGTSFGTLSADGVGPTPSSDRPGCFLDETYLVFDNTDGLVSSSGVASFNIGLIFWLRLDELPAADEELLRFNTKWGLRVLTDGTLQAWGADGATIAFTTTYVLPVGEWVHVVFGSDSNGFTQNTKLYVNGTQVGTGADVVTTGTFTLRIGGTGLHFAIARMAHFSYSDTFATQAPLLYAARGIVWNVIPEITSGGGSGIDASENDTPITAAPRSRVNFIAGSNVTVDVVDDSGGDEVEVTIAATSPAGSGIEVSEAGVDVTASPRGRLDFVASGDATVSVADDAVNDKAVVTIGVIVPPDELPDTSGHNEDDVLTLDATLAPVWAAPAGGGGGSGIEASEGGVDVTAAARSRVNFIAGTDISLDVADDPTNDKIDVTITSTASGGGGSANPEDENLVVALEVLL